MTTAPFEPGTDPDQIPGEPMEQPDPIAPGEPGGPDAIPTDPDRPDESRGPSRGPGRRTES